MPIHPDFQKILDSMIEQYGEEKGKKVYYAWLKKMGYDDTKPMPKKEGFGWVGDVKPIPGVTNLIRGQALHPIKTYHFGEWPSLRVYLEEELEKSAKSLIGKPLFLDHWKPLNGKVYGAHYEDGALEYIAGIEDEDVLRMIRDGEIKHCSVEFEWKSLENVDGIAPRGLNFIGLSFLRSFEPGDPLTTVEIWNQIVEALIPRIEGQKISDLSFAERRELYDAVVFELKRRGVPVE